MTKENLVTAPVGTNMEQAQEILRRHRIESCRLWTSRVTSKA